MTRFFLGMGLSGVTTLLAFPARTIDFMPEDAVELHCRAASGRGTLRRCPLAGRVVVFRRRHDRDRYAGVQGPNFGRGRRSAIVYRRGPAPPPPPRIAIVRIPDEQEHAPRKGRAAPLIWAMPSTCGDEGQWQSDGCEVCLYRDPMKASLLSPDDTFTLPADQVFKAIGQFACRGGRMGSFEACRAQDRCF